MDFGVAVQGAGSAGHFYSQSGGTSAAQESGNGVTAGFRFGF